MFFERGYLVEGVVVVERNTGVLLCVFGYPYQRSVNIFLHLDLLLQQSRCNARIISKKIILGCFGGIF